MAIVFNKKLEVDKLTLAFNNNVVEYYSDSGVAPDYSTITVGGQTVTVYPDPNGIFTYNFKTLMVSILNKSNYADTLETDLSTSYVYDWSDEVHLEGYVVTNIYLSNDTTETSQKYVNWLSGYVNLKDWKTFYPSADLLTNSLGLLQKVNGTAYYNHLLKYWIGYPFDVTIFNDNSDAILTNNNNLLTYDLDMDGFTVTRLAFSDGRTDNTIEDALPMSDGINDLVFYNGSKDFNIALFKDTTHCPNGVYIKWINSLGGWNYWLFPKGQEFKKISSRGDLFNDSNNIEDTTSPYVSQGFESNNSIKVKQRRLSENYKVLLDDLLDSAKVYLFNGTPFSQNTFNDWLEVKLKDGTYKVDNSRSDLYTYDFEFALPKNVTRSL